MKLITAGELNNKTLSELSSMLWPGGDRFGGGARRRNAERIGGGNGGGGDGGLHTNRDRADI